MTDKKRAQMEIMGIAVVVVLILFGMLFYIRISLTSDDQESAQQQFQKASMATYFIQSMLESSIRPGDCDVEGRVKDLITDCVTNAGCGRICNEEGCRVCDVEDECPGSDTNCMMCTDASTGNDITSCEYLRSEVLVMLGETLVLQGRDYKLTIGSSDDIYISLKSESCSSVRQFREFVLANGEKIRMSMCE